MRAHRRYTASSWFRCCATVLMVALCQEAALGARVTVTLKGEVELPHATLTAIEQNTYDEKLQQLHEYLANTTGLGTNDSDYVTARFGLSDNPVRANFSWTKVVDASLAVDLDRLRGSSVYFMSVNVDAESPSTAAVPSAAVAVIAVLASLLFLLLLAAAGLAVRAKWRRSSVGVIPAIDVVHRRGGDDASFAETGTYRRRGFADLNSSEGDLVGDTMPRGDEAAIIRAWVQAQLRESQVLQLQQQQLQQQQLQHLQAPKKPKRFSFRLIGKSVDHFDSGVASTSKSTRSRDADDETLVMSATIRSAAEVAGGAGQYATGGRSWMQHAATENARAPIYKKNQPRHAAAASAPPAAAASDAREPTSGAPDDREDDGYEAEEAEMTSDDRVRATSLPSLPDACDSDANDGVCVGGRAQPPPAPRGRSPGRPSAVVGVGLADRDAEVVSAEVHCLNLGADESPSVCPSSPAPSPATTPVGDASGAAARGSAPARANHGDCYGSSTEREICRL